MTSLIRTDFRLSADGLLPWALIVVGLIGAGALLINLPETIVRESVARLTVPELLDMVAALSLASAPFIAAAIVALVFHGDRRHNAEAMMATLPIPASRRLLSKVVVVVVAALLPFVVALLLTLVESSLRGSGRDAGDLTAAILPAATVGTIIAVGLTLAVTPLVRSAIRTLLCALSLGVLASAVGVLGHLASFGTLTSEIREVVAEISPASRHESLRAIETTAVNSAVTATVTAMLLVALLGAAIGLYGMVRRRSRRLLLTLLAVSLIAPLVGGVLATRAVIQRELIDGGDHLSWMIRRNLATERQIIAATHALQGDPEAVRGTYSLLYAQLGQLQVIAMPPEEREAHPITRALRQLRNLTDERRAAWWIFLAPDRPEDRLVDALEAIERFPHSHELQRLLIDVLTAVAGDDRLTPEAPAGSAWARQQEVMLNLGEQHRRLSAVAAGVDDDWSHPAVAAERSALDAQLTLRLSGDEQRRAIIEELVARLRRVAAMEEQPSDRMLAVAERFEALLHSFPSDSAPE